MCILETRNVPCQAQVQLAKNLESIQVEVMVHLLSIRSNYCRMSMVAFHTLFLTHSCNTFQYTHLQLTPTHTHTHIHTHPDAPHTQTHSLLHKHSNHHKHTFRAIIKSQITRFHRICSFPSDLHHAIKILFHALHTRHYSKRFLRSIKNETLTGLAPTHSNTPHTRHPNHTQNHSDTSQIIQPSTPPSVALSALGEQAA